MRKSLSFLLLSISVGVSAQSDLVWRKGVVVLSDRTVITGTISYQSSQQLVLFHSGEQMVVLPAHRIESFRFYDAMADINRQFISIKMQDRRCRIFEVVIQGKVKVVRNVRSTVSGTGGNEVADYDYFTLAAGQMEPIHKFRSKIYPRLVEEYPLEMRSYVSSQGLDANNMKSALLIIREYNRIHQNLSPLSRGIKAQSHISKW